MTSGSSLRALNSFNSCSIRDSVSATPLLRRSPFSLLPGLGPADHGGALPEPVAAKAVAANRSGEVVSVEEVGHPVHVERFAGLLVHLPHSSQQVSNLQKPDVVGWSGGHLCGNRISRYSQFVYY
jgi:hypothetical protein